MKLHELKCWPEPFEALRSGAKLHEYRRDDRGFAVGDRLLLRRWDPESASYSGRAVEVAVTYISRGPGFGIPEGYVVMSVDLVRDFKLTVPVKTR